MKLLFAFLILFPAISLATIRVTVVTQKDGTYQKDFASQPEADAFITNSLPLFGKVGTYSYSSADVTALLAQADADAASVASAKATLQGLFSKSSFTAAEIQTALKALIQIDKK